MRAYNASPSREKTVWKNDTQRMVLKTAAWVLYNNVLKPYIEIPTSLKKDWEETNDQMEFESLNAESQEQQDIIHQNVGEGDIVAFDDEASHKLKTQGSKNMAKYEFKVGDRVQFKEWDEMKRVWSYSGEYKMPVARYASFVRYICNNQWNLPNGTVYPEFRI